MPARDALHDVVHQALVKDGYSPILFCRFIDTAEYVASHLRDALSGGPSVGVRYTREAALA